MKSGRRFTIAAFLLVLGSLGACASLPENLISEPKVRLLDVQVLGLGFRSQTFLLSFDIHNPNPFPLPVNHVSYGVRLDGRRFASGKTPGDISVPASGDSQFQITVELDLLTTAPQLMSVIRDGVRAEVPYELDGTLGIDIPMAPPISYSNNGVIRLATPVR